jgi:serine/threonine-protein kinase ATR
VQAALSVAQDQNRIKDLFPRMRAFNPQVDVMMSKARPKRVRIFMVPGGRTQRQRDDSGKQLSDDIGELHFLVKNEEKGDLRKDARVQDLNNVINRLLATSCKGMQNHRRLNLRTFAVTCLSEDCGVLEWVPNTESFRGLVAKTYNPQAMSSSPRRRGKRLRTLGDSPALREAFDKCQSKYFKEGNLTDAAKMFDDLCLGSNPPLFYWWFVQNFMDPHSWYEARTRFAHTAAAWSAVGHVIGLGDRHSENILIDTSSGACVHVDFDCIFDKGLILPRPEVIPFRLTSNMVDAFGPVGADGIFTSSLKTAMSTLRDNRDTLLSVLEPFLKDPIIDWNRHRSQQKDEVGTSSKESQDAKQSMKVIEERLRGIYNLRNPNLKKIARIDRVSNNEDDDMMYLLPLSVEGQVHKMITEATSSENLMQCYVGWTPWLKQNTWSTLRD